MIGQIISHYKILEKLGEGGMGVVYKAEDTKLKRLVALKFLPHELTGNAEAKERFLHEAQAAAALEHQNICNIFEIDESEGQMFIVMSYIEGQDLREKIARGPLKIEETLKIAIQAAEGLQEAHEKGIVHRDIKSANIMINDKGQVKVMDFGLAKLKGQSKLTKEGSTVGTAAYMSPEQAQGANVDHRVDIWSLGVVFYEMITGRLPFNGEYEQAVVYSILNEEPEPLTALRTGVPLELERIVNKMLAKDPAERYQHADDLLVDVRKLKKDSASERAAVKYKTLESTAKPGKRFMIPAILLLTVIIVVAGYFIFKGKPEPVTPEIVGDKPSLAIVYFENKSGDKSLEKWREALSQLLTTDLSQSKYLRVLRSDQVYSIFKRLNLLETKRYSTEDLQKVAQKGRVNRILKGSYIKAGDNFVVTAMLIDAATGETISSLSVEAKGEKEIFTKVDDLTKQVKLNLDLTPDQVFTDVDSNVGEITTSSPGAYKRYIEALNYFNKLQYRKAIQLLEKAVTIDPGFAIAYRKLSVSYLNLGYDVLPAEYLKKAFDLRHRVSEHERLVLQAIYYYQSEKTVDKALESFNRLLQIYPGHLLGISHLGILYQQLEEWDKALECFKVLIDDYDESFINAYDRICEIYLAKGLENKAGKVIENNIEKIANPAAAHRIMSWLYNNLGRYDRSLIEMGKAFSLDSSHYQNIRCLGDIYFCRAELGKAANEYKKLLQHKEIGAPGWYIVRMASLNSMQGKIDSQKAFIEAGLKKAKEWNIRWFERYLRFQLGLIYRKTGNPGAALEEYDKVSESADEDGKLEDLRIALWNIGLTYLEMGAMEKARETAERLKSLIETGVNPKKIRYYYHLQGEIAAKTKEFSRAAVFFDKALAGVPGHWDFRIVVLDSLGAAYLQAGNIDKARETYEKIIDFNGTARMTQSHLLSMSFFKLGKIYQKLGLKDKALNAFNKFIELRKDCDPQFRPLVDDAKKRVGVLAGK